jgi:large subunit ribosomal protein L29
MKAHQVRELDNNDIQNELRNMDEQRFRLKFQISMGQMDGVKKVRAMRKDRAGAGGGEKAIACRKRIKRARPKSADR